LKKKTNAYHHSFFSPQQQPVMRWMFLILCILNSQYHSAQQHILTLHIKGIDSTQNQQINNLSYQKKFKNHAALSTETERIQKQLEQLGYIDIELLEITKKDSTHTAIFDLQQHYTALKIAYDARLISPKKINTISNSVSNTHFIIPIKDTERALEQLSTYSASKGKPFSQIRLSELEKRKDSLYAKLLIDESNLRTIDTLVLKGYQKYPKSYLNHYNNVKKGQKFNKQVLLKKCKTINTLRFANTTKPPEVLFTKDSTAVYLYLQKKTSNAFDGFIGFSTNEETQKLVFDGYINLDLINNLNYGERLNLIYKSDGNEQQRFQVATTLPYLFKTPLSLEAELDIFKKDSTFVTTQQHLDLHYTFGTHTDSYIGYKKSTSSNLLQQPQVGIEVNSYEGTFLTNGISYTNHQNHPLFPIKTNISLTTAFGTRSSQHLENEQFQADITVEHLFNLNKRNALFFKNTSSILISDHYLFNELFRFGGITSIRGFEENSLYASLLNVTITEYRYLLTPDLYLHSILDYAYFEDKTTQSNTQLTGVGFGLGMYTKSGLFKINFANGKTKNQNFEFSNTKVHFSVVAFF